MMYSIKFNKLNWQFFISSMLNLKISEIIFNFIKIIKLYIIPSNCENFKMQGFNRENFINWFKAQVNRPV